MLDMIMLGAISLICFIVFASTQLTIDKKDKKKNKHEKKEN